MAHYYRAAVLCRLCREMATRNNTVPLFIKSGYKQNLPSRINSLLEVNITDNNDLPKHICLKCKRRLESLEKSALDLKSFKVLVNETHSALSRRPLKRTKETSGASNISPSTLRVRPSSKRLSSARQLHFGKIIVVILNLLSLSVLYRF